MKNKVTRYHNQPDSIRRSHASNLMLYSEQKEREGLDRKGRGREEVALKTNDCSGSWFIKAEGSVVQALVHRKRL